MVMVRVAGTPSAIARPVITWRLRKCFIETGADRVYSEIIIETTQDGDRIEVTVKRPSQGVEVFGIGRMSATARLIVTMPREGHVTARSGDGSIRIDGSSTVYPISNAIAEAFYGGVPGPIGGQALGRAQGHQGLSRGQPVSMGDRLSVVGRAAHTRRAWPRGAGPAPPPHGPAREAPGTGTGSAGRFPRAPFHSSH